MRNQRSMTKSQYLASGLVLAAVFIMLAPLRPGPSGMQTQSASFIPLLAASGVAETNAFHRLASVENVHTSSAPLLRTPTSKRSVPVPHTAKQSATKLSVDFLAPRTSWKHLDHQTRAGLDAAIKHSSEWRQIILHGSSVESAHQLDRMHRLVRGQQAGHPYHVIIGARTELGTAWAAEESTLHICLTGDFQRDQPSSAQMEALDEMIDYLSIKLGQLPVATHTCLGAAFPAAEIMAALNEKR